MAEHTLAEGEVKVGKAQVKYRIFLSRERYKQIAALIQKQVPGGMEGFAKEFNSIILPVINHVFENDRYLKMLSLSLKKIEVMIAFSKESEAEAATSPMANTSAYFRMQIELPLILKLMKNQRLRGKYNARRLMTGIEHEIVHFMEENGLLEVSLKKTQFVMQQINFAVLATGGWTKEKFLLQAGNLNFFFFIDFINKCRAEGIAKFREAEYTERIPVTTKFHKMLRKVLYSFVTKQARKPEAQKIYDRFPYYIGNFMCVVIALAMLKKSRRQDEVCIFADSQRLPIDSMNECFEKYEKFYVSKIPGDILHKTIWSVHQLDAGRFIMDYNEACELLGISPEHRILFWEYFTKVEAAFEKLDNRIKGILEKQGYEVSM